MRSLLKIEWRLGPDYPMGIQDSAVGFVGGKLVSAGGFSRHPREVLRDHPDAFEGQTSGFTRLTFALAYQDRYVLLLAGYKYARTWLLDGTSAVAYTEEEQKRDLLSFFEDTVLVYDTVTGELGTADPLLEKTSYPSSDIVGHTIYCLGGEGGPRLFHPATLQIGTIVGGGP